MKKAIVIYASKYGTTEKYARWIADEAGAGVSDVRHVRPFSLFESDTVIFGGSMLAGNVRGIDYISKHSDMLNGKKLIIFTCGISNPEDAAEMEKIDAAIRSKLPENLRSAKIFHLRGGVDYGRLGFFDKTMLGMMCKMLKDKPSEQITENERVIIDTYGKSVDFMSRESIAPIVQACREE
ncbi:MAG: flavodoxin domain-containing protein [Firmicutes bacterium]|nr:flavodoxin domain-containing protein [Bacillota bacterium]